MGVAFGIGLVLACMAGLILAVVLLDWMFNLPPVPRILTMLIALASLVYVLRRWVVLPLMAKLSIGDVASRLEAAFPQFDDRLRSTVDFLRGGVPGSEMMQDRVVNETTQLASTLNLQTAVVVKPVWYSTAAGAGSILLLMIATLLVTPQFRSIAISRLFSPFNGQPWPKSVQIEMLGDVPRRIPLGQHLDLKMKLCPR